MTTLNLEEEIIGIDEIFDNLVVEEEKDINIFEMFINKHIEE